MLGKKGSGRGFGVVLGTVYALLVTGVVYHFWPGMNTALAASIFIGVWLAAFLAGTWAFVAQLNTKIPISGKELRRSKKEFYDWLASLGRR